MPHGSLLGTGSAPPVFDISLAFSPPPQLRLFYSKSEALRDALTTSGPGAGLVVPRGVAMRPGSPVVLLIHVFGRAGDVALHARVAEGTEAASADGACATHFDFDADQPSRMERVTRLASGLDLDLPEPRFRQLPVRIPALRDGASSVAMVRGISITGLQVRGLHLPWPSWRFRLHGSSGGTVVVSGQTLWRSTDLREVGVGFEFVSTWQRRTIARMVHELERSVLRADLLL